MAGPAAATRTLPSCPVPPICSRNPARSSRRRTMPCTGSAAGWAGRRSRIPAQQADHLRVVDLAEIQVEPTDGAEIRRRIEADQLVAVGLDLAQGLWRRHRHRTDQLFRLPG